MTLLFLVLDEQMSGWYPKTYKLGGLPKWTHEPRIPVPIGAILNNFIECNTGMIVCDEVVQNPENNQERSDQKIKQNFLTNQIFLPMQQKFWDKLKVLD